MLTIQVTDDGQGYPPAVLAVLQAGETGENPPHILGLHVVEQILSRPRRHCRFCPSPAPRRGRYFDPAAVKTKRPLPENSDRGRAIYKLGAVG